jgi:hypothetical protein
MRGAQPRQDDGKLTTASIHTQEKTLTVTSDGTGEPEPENPQQLEAPPPPPRRCSDDKCECSTFLETMVRVEKRLEELTGLKERMEGMEERLLDKIGGMFANWTEELRQSRAPVDHGCASKEKPPRRRPR